MIYKNKEFITKAFKSRVKLELKTNPDYIKDLKYHFNKRNKCGWPLNYYAFIDSYKKFDSFLFLQMLSAIKLKVVYFDGSLFIIRREDEIKTYS